MTLAANPPAQDADLAQPSVPSLLDAAFPDSSFGESGQRRIDRRQSDRRHGDRRQNDHSNYAGDRRQGAREGDRRQLDRRINDRLAARPAGPVATLFYRGMELLGIRRPRQLLIRYVYPWVLISAYAAATMLCLVLALHDAVLGSQRNGVLRAQYEDQLQQWHTRVAAAQNLTSGAVASVGETFGGRTEVSVILDGGGTVKIDAESRCVASRSLSAGSYISVLQVSGVPSIPAVLSADPMCLSPSSVTAAAGSAYAPPRYPLLSTIRAHLVVVSIGIFGMTLFALGLWRRLQRIRYGVGNSMNIKRKARRRDFVVGIGLAMMITALLIYPMLDTLKPTLHRFGLA